MKTAVIIVGHGSRSGGADLILKRIAGEIKKSGRFEIMEHAFLQYVQPGVDEALKECIRQGAGKIVLVPFFMQPGKHVMKDIPCFIERTKKQYPALEITVTDFVGAHPDITKIVMDMAGKAR